MESCWRFCVRMIRQCASIVDISGVVMSLCCVDLRYQRNPLSPSPTTRFCSSLLLYAELRVLMDLPELCIVSPAHQCLVEYQNFLRTKFFFFFLLRPLSFRTNDELDLDETSLGDEFWYLRRLRRCNDRLDE